MPTSLSLWPTRLARPVVGSVLLALIFALTGAFAPAASAQTASVSLSSLSGETSSSLAVKGNGFPKRSSGAVLFGTTRLATFKTSPTGTFSVSSQVPSGYEGAVTVAGVVGASTAAATFTVTVLSVPVPSEPVVSGPVSGRLRWAPPVGWGGFTEVTVPATGGTLDLSSDRDYRLVAPQVRTQALHIRGGRNIVWIGGQISIGQQGSFPTATSRRALVVSDAADGSSVPGRVVHLEGLLLDGSDLAEGINTNAPSAVFQLQNIRVELVKIRGADDRDGTGGYPAANHPDVVQLWGSKRELRIDGLTGRSNYQGLFFNEDSAARTRGPNLLRRVNIEMVETVGEDGRRYAGHRGYTWTAEHSGRQFLDDGTVWLATHGNSGWTGSGSFRKVAYRDSNGTLVNEPVLGSSVFGDNLHPALRNTGDFKLQQGTDPLGTFASWSASASVQVAPGVPAVRNLTDTAPGRVYSGRPPTGDYVPAGNAGRNYTSPGYTS